MMNKVDFSGRVFQVWEYQVSHGQLLVRSPKTPATSSSPERSTNVDISLFGVEYLALPRTMRGLEIVLAEPSELSTLSNILGRTLDLETVKVFHSGPHRFFVVAARIVVNENDWDIFDSPFEFRSQFRGA
jgi:hypothetical protein